MKKHDWKFLQTCNMFPKMKGSDYRIDINTHKLKKLNSISWNVPWYYVNNDPERVNLCRSLQTIFETLDFIPSFCLGCWKVVVSPNTLRQLYQLKDLQEQMAKDNPKCWCKCGVEVRHFTAGRLYGGYFYTNSKEAGLERWREVRTLVDQHIGEDVSVILKRYCSEYEQKFGDPEKYEQPLKAKPQEIMFLGMLDRDTPEHHQPDWALLQVEQTWILHGWRYGTPEDRKQIEEDHNEGKPLYPSSRTYNPEV